MLLSSSASEVSVEEQRKAKADTKLRKLLAIEDPSLSMPLISLVCSGGSGLRAYAGSVGFMDGLAKCGLLDACTYIVGGSGSCLFLGRWLASALEEGNPFHPDRPDPWRYGEEAEFPLPIDLSHIDFEVLVESMDDEELANSADQWAKVVLDTFFCDVRDRIPWSEVKLKLEGGAYPIPVLTFATPETETAERPWKILDVTPFEVTDGLSCRIPTERFEKENKLTITKLLAAGGSFLGFELERRETEGEYAEIEKWRELRKEEKEPERVMGYVSGVEEMIRKVRRIDGKPGDMLLLDSAVDMNIPFPSILRRRSNLVIILDAGSGSETCEELEVAQRRGYIELHAQDKENLSV
jgi:hypothetical protein